MNPRYCNRGEKAADAQEQTSVTLKCHNSLSIDVSISMRGSRWLINQRRVAAKGGQPVERVAFVIPTLNEALSIGLMIESIPIAELAANGYETAVYVIDGRSVDHAQETNLSRINNLAA